MRSIPGRVKRAFWGAAVLIVAAGAGVYAGRSTASDPYGLSLPKVVAKVGNGPIAREMVYQRLRQYAGMAQGGFQDKSPQAMKRRVAGIVDELIRQRILLREAARMGIEVTDAEVETQFTRARMDLGGPAEFEKKLREGNTSAETLKNDIRDALLAQKLDLSMQQAIPISEPEVREFFEKNRSGLIQDEIRARHILVETAAEAEEVLRLLTRERKDFAELARQRSKDTGSRERGGALGWFTRGRTVPEFEQAVFGLKPGRISGPVRTPFGYHVIQVEEFRSAKNQTFAEHRDHVEGLLRGQKWQAQRDAWLGDLYRQAGVWKAAEVVPPAS